MNIFKTSKIRFTELYQDSINYLSSVYGDIGQYFSMASPMGQLLQVTLNYGRMILYYVEDSITELNILTALRPNSIRGLASLSGHNPSRAMSARGSLKLSYNGAKLNTYGSVIIIPNYTTLNNLSNGLTYTIILPGEDIRLNLTSPENYLIANVVQGELEYQQATGNGDALQSFNFATKKGLGIDNYFVRVFVNGKLWQIEESIIDMSFNAESCMVKTGQTGGVDVFFGNGYNGKVPELGSTILIEYLITNGATGNINTMESNSINQWKFKSPGYSLTGENIDLNKYININTHNTILFGTYEEPLYLTRLLAPNTSKSYVLANTINYIYFLRKLNIFTIIDAIPGFATFNDQYYASKYQQSQTKVKTYQNEFNIISSLYSSESTQYITAKSNLDTALLENNYLASELANQKLDDNTIYLFLIPDVNKRITAGLNYYTAPIESFSLSDNEKTALLNLIEESGQRIITVENAILEIKYPKFVLNLMLILWEGYDYDVIRQNIISKTSTYFLKNTRRDRIPISDLIKVVEDIDGVDSVSVWFDAAQSNSNIYGKDNYGLDEYGDIILERYILDAWNNKIPVKDVYPLIRGGFTSYNGVEYEDSTAKNKLSTINIQVRGVTSKDLNKKHNIAITQNL